MNNNNYKGGNRSNQLHEEFTHSNREAAAKKSQKLDKRTYGVILKLHQSQTRAPLPEPK